MVDVGVVWQSRREEPVLGPRPTAIVAVLAEKTSADDLARNTLRHGVWHKQFPLSISVDVSGRGFRAFVRIPGPRHVPERRVRETPRRTPEPGGLQAGDAEGGKDAADAHLAEVVGGEVVECLGVAFGEPGLGSRRQGPQRLLRDCLEFGLDGTDMRKSQLGQDGAALGLRLVYLA